MPIFRSTKVNIARWALLTKRTLKRNRDGQGTTWFHPRACMVPRENSKPVVLMNMQAIGGSDYFGKVHWMQSNDLGASWVTAGQCMPKNEFKGDLLVAEIQWTKPNQLVNQFAL